MYSRNLLRKGAAASSASCGEGRRRWPEDTDCRYLRTVGERCCRTQGLSGGTTGTVIEADIFGVGSGGLKKVSAQAYGFLEDLIEG